MSRFPQTILATCCVPWTAKGEVDEPIFRASIRGLIDAGLRDLYVFGTAGEGYAVNEQQFDEVVAIFTGECRARAVEPMVGIISLSLSTVIDRIERCSLRGLPSFSFRYRAGGR